MVGLQAAVAEVPDLDDLVPSGGHDDGVAGGGRETDSRHPVGVAVLSDGVLALSKGVPQLDASVARSGNDLTVVSGESDGEDVLGVRHEATGGLSGLEIPETESLVPGSGEGEHAIGRDNDVRDEVAVSGEGTDGAADGGLVGSVSVDVPDEDGVVWNCAFNSLK